MSIEPSGIGGTVIFKGAVQLDSLNGSGASPTLLCRNSLNLLSVCSFNNQDGAVEGVNYSQLTTALINAVKEQQEQLERQQQLIEALQSAVVRLEAGLP
jgi:hypothetical protein